MNCFEASAFHFAEPAKLRDDLRLISAHQPGAIGRRNSARGQIPVNPSLILLVEMTAFAVCTQSRFGGGHDDIAGLIGCGVNA